MHIRTKKVAEVLGLRSRAPISKYDLAELLRTGLRVDALDRLCRALAPEDKTFPTVLIPRETLKRRRIQKVLSPEESELLGRLAQVWAMALDVYEDEQTARKFLHEPHALLHGKKPIDMARANTFGAAVVEDILGRLKYGSAA